MVVKMFLCYPFSFFSLLLFQNKDTMDPRSRGATNMTHRGGRGGDRYGRGANQFSSSGMTIQFGLGSVFI